MAKQARLNGPISFGALFRSFWRRILATWAVVLLETVLIALIPLLIGYAIDGLLAGRTEELLWLSAALALQVLIGVGRRVYDTRVYGGIRVSLGLAVDRLHAGHEVSTRNARLDMSRELVDFLEKEVPELLTAIVQIVIALVVLSLFDPRLGVAAAAVTLAMLGVYACFHQRFYRLNADFNAQTERQVDLLRLGRRSRIFRHLKLLRRAEIRISDTEALVFGAIYLLQIAFLLYNLTVAAGMPGATAGRIFTIATYSWDYVEAALSLPAALQSWSRLSEIIARLTPSSDKRD
ncbi:MAG: ABC transporter six-transmembrane domain-containing protein [Pseudomonadota bacterium]